MKPLFITNFKNYAQSTGKNAVALAKIHQKVAEATGANLGIAVSAFDVQAILSEVDIPVFAQHLSVLSPGSSVGENTADNFLDIGGAFTLVNHSAHQISFEAIETSISFFREKNIKTVVCAATPAEVLKISAFSPNFIAFEPPELIGSSDKSVSSDAPDSITEAVNNAKDIPLLVGAGISTPEDIAIALKLGASGFLVASAITKAKNPEEILKSFAEVL